MKRALLTCGLVAAGVLLASCGDKPQTAGARKGDAAPSQGAMAAYTDQGWKQGDATSWEAHLKKRAEGQNEYTRTNRN